jgi:hypothetical protein
LFDHAVAYRQAAMEVAVDAKTELEIQERLRVVSDITTVIEMLAESGALLDNAEGGARYLGLLKHFAAWAQFEIPDYHAAHRRREEGVLTRLLGMFSGDGLLAIHEKWDVGFLNLPTGHAGVKHLKELRQSLRSRVCSLLLSRLALPLGMEMFWGDSWTRTKNLLFAPSSPVFKDATLRKAFFQLAETAASRPVVAENFLTYLRMLGYGAFDQGITFDRQACRDLLKDHEVIAAVWQAALATPLQPRQVGSLTQTRQKLISTGVPEGLLPRPDWVIASQQLFEMKSAREEPVDDSEIDEEL